MKVCYTLPGDRYYQNFDERPTFAEIVEVEISWHDVLCETIEQKLSEATNPLRVCSSSKTSWLRKLDALLQQLCRGWNRPQDVYDIASRMREKVGEVNVEKVTAIASSSRSKASRHRAEEELYDDQVRPSRGELRRSKLRPGNHVSSPNIEAWAEVLARRHAWEFSD